MQGDISPHFYYWLDDEEKRIRSEFTEKRSQINNDALAAGFDGNSLKGDKAAEVSERFKTSFADEEAAVRDFRDRAVKHETERLKLNEVDQKQQIRKAWGLK